MNKTSPTSCPSNFVYFHEVIMYSSKADKPNSHNFDHILSCLHGNGEPLRPLNQLGAGASIYIQVAYQHNGGGGFGKIQIWKKVIFKIPSRADIDGRVQDAKSVLRAFFLFGQACKTCESPWSTLVL
jgi:hypothetical protein